MSKKKNNRRKPLPSRRSLLVPMTPFEQRIAEVSTRLGLPCSRAQADMMKRRAAAMWESDLAFRKMLRDKIRRIRHWVQMRMLSSSGLLMAGTLRRFFLECCSRLVKHGPDSMPSSFNVVESFLKFDAELLLFDMRPEREHLLSVDDYFHWYKSNDMPKEPELLMTVMEEGTVYAYEMAGNSASARLSGGESTLVIAGVSLVRHGSELSCMLVAGEQPPHPPDEDVITKEASIPAPGREEVVPDPALGVKDRYLDQMPGFARVIVLGRFDLRAKKYYVRILNIDCGNSYSVVTDDLDALRPALDEEMLSNWRATTETELRRYDVLFSSMASLIFLPVAFIAEIAHVQEVEFKTECFARQSEKQVTAAMKELGDDCRITSTVVRCLARADGQGIADGTEIRPPDMTFQSEGYWKTLPPGEIGEDKDGTAIVGRTWVTRTENWSASKPHSFLLSRPKRAVTGPDPGVIYVMRSGAHALDIYKIGLTRRDPQQRGRELSHATGVPLPFGVLAQWDVGDCGRLEAGIHRTLDAYRINDRREFFRLSLRSIISAINALVEAETPRLD